VRMRPHVDALAEQELGGPHLVEEDEGPTIWRRDDGSARRTSKPPRSRARGTITVSIGLSSAWSCSHFGSIAACQLTGCLPPWVAG
jgi:hypothetical protein